MVETLDSAEGTGITLQDLAQHAHVTDKHLCRVFQDSLGISPMHTFRLMQLKLAVALLARSNLTIKQVAERCGLEDALYFSRVFSKTYGKSPREIRRQMQAGEALPESPLPSDIMPRIFW